MSATKRELNEALDNEVLAQLPVVIPVSSSSVTLGTLQASNPAALVSGAAELASQLAIVIAKQNLATVIKGKRFVNVEGWTTLAVTACKHKSQDLQTSVFSTRINCQ